MNGQIDQEYVTIHGNMVLWGVLRKIEVLAFLNAFGHKFSESVVVMEIKQVISKIKTCEYLIRLQH